MMKIKGIAVLLLALAAAVIISGQEVVEEIVAIINDDIITFSQYKAEEEGLYRALSQQLQGEELERQYVLYKKNLLDTMITNILLSQEAKKKNLNVDDQLKTYIENLKKENAIESDEELIRAMRQQGMDFEEFRRQLRDNLLRQNVVMAEIQPSIVVEDSEILSYYKLHPEEFTEPTEYRLKGIYIGTEGKTEEEIEAKKSEISAKVASGEDFGSLASLYAEGPEKENQGDLGRFKKGELEKNLEQAVENLKAGETTPWLKVRGGWHLLKLEEKKESRLKSFEGARDAIEEKLFSQKRQEKTEEFIKKLKEKSYIKILKTDL